MAEDAGTGTTTPAEGAEGTGAEQQQTPDISALVERMDGFSEQLKEFQATPAYDPYSQFDPAQQYQAPEQQQQQQAPEQTQPLVLYQEDGTPVYLDQPEQPAQADPDALREALGINDLQTELHRIQMTNRAAEYEGRYPELKDEKVWRPAAQAWGSFCEQNGRPELAGDIDLLVQHWLAGRAEQSAGSETPAGAGQEVPLEGAAGAAPEQPEVHPGDRMVNAVQGRQPPW